MAAWSKVTIYKGMGEQEPLRLITGFEAFHVALAPSCRAM
jgi:hypothetical protein